jgi:hypothetical protein
MSEFSDTTSGFVRDLGEAARQNPLSAALIGMGVLWLFTGGRPVQRTGGLVGRSGADRISEAAGDAIDAARSTVRSEAGKIGDRVTTAGDALHEGSSDALNRATRFGREQVDAASEYARSFPSAGAEMLDNVRSNLTEVFRAQPLALGAIGLAIGAGIAAAIPPSKLEAEYLGETSDAAKARATEFGTEQAGRAATIAGNVMNAVTEEARKQGLTLEGAKTAANEISAKVGRVADAAGRSERTKPTAP